MNPQRQLPPGDEEEAAAFKRMGQGHHIIRERRGLFRPFRQRFLGSLLFRFGGDTLSRQGA